MSETPQFRVLNADVIGAVYDKGNDTVDITLTLQSGDHLHILLTSAGLDNLIRHMNHVFEQMSSQTGR